MERILNINEAQNLGTVARILEAVRNTRHEVKDIYFDAGQDWWWTTIVATDDNGHTSQILSPREWKEILALNSRKECFDWVAKYLEKH